MRNIFCRILYLLIFICSIYQLNAQVNYPININPVIYPPYPVSLKFLNASSTPSMVLTITNKSANPSSVMNVNLKVSVKSKTFSAVSTSSVSGLFPITLSGGAPLRLTNLDFAAAYAFSNLTGISLRDYETIFPQSKVDFGFVLYDAITGRQLSDNVTYSVTYSVNYPPNLNLPANNSNIVEKGFQNILFQWIPRQTAPAGSVQYKFELVELLNDQQNPQSAFLTNKPIFVDSFFTTRLLYGTDYPPLFSGKTYVWRIQAQTYDNGGFLISNFQNNGYSPYYSFKYSVECKSPTMVEADEITREDANISWATAPEYENFIMSYRKKGATEWSDISIKNSNADVYSLHGLQAATQYELKVKALCANNMDAVSSIKVFKTRDTTVVERAKVNAACGNMPVIKEAAKNKLAALYAKDLFTAGDYAIEVTEVKSGANGIFSGKGIVELWLKKPFKMNVVFDKIQINTSYQMTEGTITPIK